MVCFTFSYLNNKCIRDLTKYGAALTSVTTTGPKIELGKWAIIKGSNKVLAL